MDEVLKRISAAFNPDKTAPPEYYTDCGEARGEIALARRFLRDLEQASTSAGEYLSLLFSGHIGCGKSSELAHLSYLLANPGPYQPRYLPIVIDVSQYLDDFDVDLTDMMLAMVTETAATLRDKIGYELKDSYFRSRYEEIRDLISPMEINKAEVNLLAAKVEIQRLQRSPEARQEVRKRLADKKKTMLEEINRVFDEARAGLIGHRDPMGRQPYRDIVLMFDNLEKIRNFEGQSDLDAFHELFLERYAQLKGFTAHVIYTVPLRLLRSVEGQQLTHRYGREPFVLPMVKVIERASRTPYEKGIEFIKQLLQKRLGELPLEQAFAHDALAFLLTYSGGHIRDLVRFVRNACLFSDGIPISLATAKSSIKATISMYSTTIPESHWEKLARLDVTHRIENGDDDYLQMLENVSIMEYYNGGGDDVFVEGEAWYAVNPIVRELTRFKDAARKLQSQAEP